MKLIPPENLYELSKPLAAPARALKLTQHEVYTDQQ